MSYSSLLVHVDVDGEIGGRVRLAAGLADQFHSHLIGAASWMARPPFVVEGLPIDPEPTEEDYKEMREVLSRRGKEFRAVVGGERSKVEWRSSFDFPTEFVAREARAADLVIIGRDRKLLRSVSFHGFRRARVANRAPSVERSARNPVANAEARSDRVEGHERGAPRGSRCFAISSRCEGSPHHGGDGDGTVWRTLCTASKTSANTFHVMGSPRWRSGCGRSKGRHLAPCFGWWKNNPST